MHKITLFALTAVTAVMFAACAAPVENKPVANTNANAAKPAAAPPTVAALLDIEKKAGEAWAKGDSKYFEGMLADNFVGFYGGKRTTKADEVKMIGEAKCDIKNQSITEEKMIPVGADAAVLVTRSVAEGTCGGKKLPSPSRAATLFVRSGDTWKAAYHNEVAIVEPKGAPAGTPASADKKDPAKSDASQLSVDGDDKKDEAKKAEPVKDDAKKESVKKEEAGKERDAKTDAAKPVDAAGGDDLTKALLALEQSGWDAWKAHETEKLGGMMTSEVTFIDPMGGAHFGKADNLSTWTAQKCDVKSVTLSDPKGFSILPAVAVLTFKGTAVGTCDGEKLTPVWGTGIYVKEGDAWKLAFHLEDMMRKS